MKIAPKKINRNAVSLAGEYAVLSQLALYGYDANLTLGYTKGVDILVSDPESDKMYRLEVKTNLRKKHSNKPSNSKLYGRTISGWIMNKKQETNTVKNLFYCFVNIENGTNVFSFYIVPSRIVAKYIKERHTLWLKADRKHKDNSMRKFSMGLKGEQYRFSTPIAEKYKDNWKFKR